GPSLRGGPFAVRPAGVAARRARGLSARQRVPRRAATPAQLAATPAKTKEAGSKNPASSNRCTTLARRRAPRPARRAPPPISPSGQFQRQRDALATADAHGDEGLLAADALQLVDGLHGQDGAG